MIPSLEPSSTATIDGGTRRTFPVGSGHRAVRVTLESEGLPCRAYLEVWEGPGTSKQVAEINTDDGRPVSAVIETGGYSTTVSVRNLGEMTFPIKAYVEGV